MRSPSRSHPAGERLIGELGPQVSPISALASNLVRGWQGEHPAFART
jgi:hypothetical protein